MNEHESRMIDKHDAIPDVANDALTVVLKVPANPIILDVQLGPPDDHIPPVNLNVYPASLRRLQRNCRVPMCLADAEFVIRRHRDRRMDENHH